jgi:hypothetical protein
VSTFLVSVAVAVAHALGIAMRPLWTAGPATPVVVPLMAGGAAWLPLRPLGLPGDWIPMTGGEP